MLTTREQLAQVSVDIRRILDRHNLTHRPQSEWQELSKLYANKAELFAMMPNSLADVCYYEYKARQAADYAQFAQQ